MSDMFPVPASAQIVLYDDQTLAAHELRVSIHNGNRRNFLVAPTGWGKTVFSAYLLERAHSKRSRAIFVVDRVSLCDQTSATLDKYGIPHGVIQSGHWRFRADEPIQIATAQTLEKRGIDPTIDLLIVDEAHTMRESIVKFIESNESCKVLGLSATPFSKGLGKLYTHVVNPTTTNKLIASGRLCPLKVYIATAPDMTGAKLVAGEWTASEAGKRGTKIIGDIVAEWQDKTVKHFGGPVKTIVFSASVDHGEELCRQFQAAGHNFQQISYKDSDDDRRRALIDEFRKPDSNIVGLVSCEALAKGFDVPDILCGIAARPYRKSLSGHIQMLGRAMRSFPGKDYALWLDHAGNYARFFKDVEDIFENGVQSLDDAELDAKVRPDPTEEERDEIRCGGCGFVLMPSQKVCPACGHERVRRAMVETQPGVMVEVGKAHPKLPDYLQSKANVWSQLCTLAMHRKRGDAEAAKKFAKAQYRNIYESWPNFTFETDYRTPVSEPVKSYVTSRLIAYAKAQARKAA